MNTYRKPQGGTHSLPVIQSLSRELSELRHVLLWALAGVAPITMPLGMSRLRRNLALFASAIVAMLLCAAVWFVPRATRGIRIGTGVVSHTLCSGVFVSGLDPDQLFAEALKPNPGLALLSSR